MVVKPKGAKPAPAKAPARQAAAAKPAAKAPRASVAPRDVASLAIDDHEDEEDEAPEITEQAVRAAPPWLVSLGVHAILLVILALFYLPRVVKQELLLELVYSEDKGEQLLDDTLTMSSLELPDISKVELALDLNPVDDPFAAPPQIELPSLSGMTAVSAVEAPTIGMALTGREEGMKRALLAAYGGDATTEDAVKRALDWLKRNQLRDGHWSLSGPYTNGANGENRTAATAMALLAFQGAGNTHQRGDYRQEVQKGWNALLADQDADGNFYRPGGPHNQHLYSQAQATIAICELYGMTKDEKFRSPAQKAINYAVKSQARGSQNPGGWRYQPGVDSDLSVTGWFVMALQSGLMAGLDVPSPTFEAASQFLDTVQTDGGSGYIYQPGRTDRRTPTMTAEGLLCRQYMGWQRDDPRLVAGVDYLATLPINYSEQNVYYWYYATQVMHHMGGKPWEDWNAVMRRAVPEEQVTTGPERGSWSPNQDQWGFQGGRLFVTCLSVYLLEVYYRHLPIYSHPLP